MPIATATLKMKQAEDWSGEDGAIAMSDDADDILMRRTAAGDSAAFDRLAARHMRRILALAQRLTGNLSDAEEIAQEAFFRLWQYADRWEPSRAQVTTWLYRVVVNLAIDRQRRPQWQPLDDMAEMRDGDPDALAQLAEREAMIQLDRALADLPDRQRAAVVLFHQEGLTLRHGAEALGVSEHAFGSLLARARQALKSMLGVGRT